MLAAGHSVRVVYIAERFGEDFLQSDLAALCSSVRKVCFAGVLPTIVKWLSGSSVSRAWCGSTEAKEVIAEQCIGVDVVWVEHLRGAGMLPETLSVPVVWDAVDALGPLFEGRAQLVSNPLKSWVFRIEANRTRIEETVLASRFCQTIAVTEREAFQIGPNVIPIQNGVDLDYFRPALSAIDDPSKNICMVGRWNYLPNAHGCSTFLRDVWPSVTRAFPNAVCTIVGPGCTAGSLVADAVKSAKNVVLTGSVDDIRPFIENSILTVCPVMLAAGMQNKILESIACGVPVVCTEIAAQGTVPRGMAGVLSATNSFQMVQAITSLLENPADARRCGLSGRQELERTMSWEPSYAQITALLEQVLHP
jgi:glycosyltransferase involved in cell wall biosynthesis